MVSAKNSIVKFTAIFAGGTMLSRITGLLRDMVFLRFIHGEALGTFLFAFSMPNMLRDMLGEGATNAAMVPVFAAEKDKKTEAEYRETVASVMGAMFLLFTVITLAGVALMPLVPWALRLLGPITHREMPQTEAELAEMVRLLQWAFPYFLMIGLSVFAMAPLFVAHRYGTSSWSPLILNVVLMVACVFMTGWFENPAWALVIGIWVGGLLQLVVQFWDMHRTTGVLLPKFRLRHPAVAQVFWLLLPVIIGQATGEVNKVVERFFAYSLGPDKVAALYVSNRLVQLPLSIFGTAVAVAILPTLSRAGARGEYGTVKETLLRGFCQSFFLVAPAMAGLLAIREPLIRLLFQWGVSDANATRQAADALLYAGMGLVSYSWVKVSIQGFYAIQNTKIPVIAATISMAMNIVLNILLVRPMGYLGLAFSTTLSYTLNFMIVYIFLCRRYGRMWDAPFLVSLAKIALAAASSGFAAWIIARYAEAQLGSETFIYRCIPVFSAISIAVVVYFGIALLMGIAEARQTFALFSRRLR